MDRPYNVLFLCTGNSARSILAECIMNRTGAGRFVAYSAGSQPAGRVHPLALALLEREGFATSALRSKSWDELSGPGAPPLDFVFTVCDNAASESCPVWSGGPVTAHWGIPDPPPSWARTRPRRARSRRHSGSSAHGSTHSSSCRWQRSSSACCSNASI